MTGWKEKRYLRRAERGIPGIPKDMKMDIERKRREKAECYWFDVITGAMEPSGSENIEGVDDVAVQEEDR